MDGNKLTGKPNNGTDIATNDRMLWRAMSLHVLKGHGTKKGIIVINYIDNSQEMNLYSMTCWNILFIFMTNRSQCRI